MTQLCRSSTCSSSGRGKNKHLTFKCMQKIQVWLLLTFTSSPQRPSMYFFRLRRMKMKGGADKSECLPHWADTCYQICDCHLLVVFGNWFSPPRTNLRYPGSHLTEEPNPRIFIKWSTRRGKCEHICETHPSSLPLRVRHRGVLSPKNNSCRL